MIPNVFIIVKVIVIKMYYLPGGIGETFGCPISKTSLDIVTYTDNHNQYYFVILKLL